MNNRLHVCSSVHEGDWSADVEEKGEAHETTMSICDER